MIICPYCRTSNRDGSNFCNECGRPLNRAVAPPIVADEGAVAPTPPAAPPPTYPLPTVPPPTAAPPATRPTPPPTTYRPPATASSSGCGGCGLVLLLGLVGLAALSHE